jgi:hypothetical protein
MIDLSVIDPLGENGPLVVRFSSCVETSSGRTGALVRSFADLAIHESSCRDFVASR